eukprot:3850647-Amphidinium_carterae.1
MHHEAAQRHTAKEIKLTEQEGGWHPSELSTVKTSRPRRTTKRSPTTCQAHATPPMDISRTSNAASVIR